ncbi:hypothetical protein B0H63DRAFT_103800 [Podospora didyma]|uniref:LYR motif-containing protein Cup1-like N-terminal domain-containing protein n=1 Tax=Podospora didyma TaxID=330526 RepID=A0AAE0NY19_9PEZI|nr:hypothetical protein B0H63DRAFT_103800 [Podospora didyma]
MSFPLRIPHPKTTLHLYRHLLREASYLPTIARPYLESQIKQRFHHNQDTKDNNKQRIRQAHHDLRYLRAANAGDMDRMRRVLQHAFGRIGRRRRQLLESSMLAKAVLAPADSAELKEHIEQQRAIVLGERKEDWLDRWDLTKLAALLKSQAHANLSNSPKAAILNKKLNPAEAIPKTNSWGRPIAPKLARSKLRSWWRLMLVRVQPPIPRDEWEMLGDIVKGKTPLVTPARRALAANSSFSSDEVSGSSQDATSTKDEEWGWQSYATQRVADVDIQKNRRNKALSGMVDDTSPMGDPRPLNVHKFTARTWRRLLGTVWQLTSVMEKRPDGNGWQIEWGKLKWDAPKPTGMQLEFFEDAPAATDASKPARTRRNRRINNMNKSDE